MKNAYPLPLISELVDKLKNSKIFTKLDVQWGYNNILIRPKNHWKAAFSTPFGLYEPTVMFFRLYNSPATFQAYCHIPYDRPSQLRRYSPLPTPLETNSGMFSPRTCFRTSGHVLGSPLVILHFSYLLLY